MSSFLLKIDVPDGDKCRGCPYLICTEVIEVGMSPNEYSCGLFHKSVDYGWGSEKCKECEELCNTGGDIHEAGRST